MLICATDPDNATREISVDRNGNILTFQGAVAVTPSDTVDLVDGPTKGLYIGGAGNVVAIMQDGSEVTFTALAIGVMHHISVKRVNAALTTATSILALY